MSYGCIVAVSNQKNEITSNLIFLIFYLIGLVLYFISLEYKNHKNTNFTP